MCISQNRLRWRGKGCCQLHYRLTVAACRLSNWLTATLSFYISCRRCGLLLLPLLRFLLELPAHVGRLLGSGRSVALFVAHENMRRQRLRQGRHHQKHVRPL